MWIKANKMSEIELYSYFLSVLNYLLTLVIDFKRGPKANSVRLYLFDKKCQSYKA